MDSTSEASAAPCERCGRPLIPGALACDTCHALVHAKSLDELSTNAKAHEARGEFALARDQWLKALALLPAGAVQAEWIKTHAAQLDAAAKRTAQNAERSGWARRFGPLAPAVLLLAKGKFLLSLLKLKFLLSFAAFAGAYWALYGWKFGVGFALLILLHEMGHFIEIKRRGWPAQLPVFIPGLGAYVRWAAQGVTIQARGYVSLAGPIAGGIGAAVCAGLWVYVGSDFWLGLASLTAFINLLNLIPIGILDGGQAMLALDKGERIAVSVVSVLCAIVYSQPMFLLVTAGAVYRLFTKDLPPAPGRMVTGYYIVLLVCLGFLMQLGHAPHAAG